MLIGNRKAHFNYEILETFNAGIELLGNEVKSLRAKQGSLEGAYVILRGGEAFLVKATIPAYQPKNTSKEYDPERPRKLLFTKAEIAKLTGFDAKKGLTIVPISVYNKGRKIKVEVGVGRGKKKYDKRETLKRRDAERDMERVLKEH
ncbi:MAG: SsrA-binding protein SmpB [bacterium]|nr:SsrA-binding protein SmpB [bacterium]